MPKIAATIVKTIAGSTVTTDGCHMVLQLRTTDGDDLALGVGHAQLMELIDHCAAANVQCEDILCSGIERAAPVSWWKSAVDPKSGEFILTLTFGKGGSLSFALTDHMTKALQETLRVRFEESAPRAAPDNAANVLPWPNEPSERRLG
jgi:hypothetical protein